VGAAGGNLDAQLDGSPTDALVFGLLLVAGIAVLFRRKQLAGPLLKRSGLVLVFFSYCLISCLWSPFPDVAFKRWIKDVGDLTMVLVIITDPQPVEALRRLFARVGSILIPSSLFLIRYSSIGRQYDPSGGPMNTGVTTNKNTLGLITFVVALGVLWSFLNLLRDKQRPNRGRHLIARGFLLAFCILVLQEAHSATSIACFLFGTTLILATNLAFFRRNPGRVQALVFTILILGTVSIFFGGESTVVSALGRDPTTLGDRTFIWAAVIPVCPNALVGAGFESFWNGYGRFVTKGLSKYERGLNSAHDGYIEVYLNLGLVGLGMIAMLLISGFRRATSAFQRSPEVGSLMLAFVATVTIYSITESGYRIMTPTWMAFLLVIVGSQSTAYRGSNRAQKNMNRTTSRAIKHSTESELAIFGQNTRAKALRST
jgi:O-antigen ligase